MNEIYPGVTEEQYDALWDAIAKVRDANPRAFNDVPTDEIIAVAVEMGWKP